LAAIAIVGVSAGSAVSVLKAAVYDERASHEDALYRQQLVSWEQANRQREEEVAQDVALFGSYEQHALRARDLRRAAGALAADPRLANAFRSRAGREQAAAVALLGEFRVTTPRTSGRGAPSYDPSLARRQAASSPNALAEDLSPGEHRIEARSAREDGVQMAAVALAFLSALFLLTSAQVYAAWKAPKAKADESPPPPRASILRLAYGLFAAGAVLAVVATDMGLKVVT
jgi:hypothetical protein